MKEDLAEWFENIKEHKYPLVSSNKLGNYLIAKGIIADLGDSLSKKEIEELEAITK